MSRKAVDVVLLPDERMTDIAIQANAELVKRFGEMIVLNKENCLPHISLAMGCMDDKQVSDIKEVLEKITGDNPIGDLQITGVTVGTNAVGQKVSSLEVRNTERLQKLHEDVMNKVGRFFSHDVNEDMLSGDEKKAESTLIWIKNYREKSAFPRFRPHITIGYGQFEGSISAKGFEAKQLALCQLGNHCTCREVLASVSI